MLQRRTFVATIAGMAIIIPSPASATILPVIGGPGGSPFELRCGENEYLVGARANVGAWVDGLGILCATSDAAPPRQIGWVGGRGGVDQEAYCPRGGRAQGFRGNFTRADGTPRQYLNGIVFVCNNGVSTCIDSGQGCAWTNLKPNIWMSQYTGSDALGYGDGYDCPNDEVLVGLVGKSGKYVDSVGAICGRPTATEASYPPRAVEISPMQRPTAPSYPPPTSNRPSSFEAGPRSTAGYPSAAAPSIVPPVGQCRAGYVWREAGPSDLICVTPAARDRARLENDLAARRIDPNSAYGPSGCRSGFVWREAFPGDLACVPPQSRASAAAENAMHHQNRN